MSATDKLRRLLDDAGVEWWQRKGYTKWAVECDKGRTTFWAWDCYDGTLTVGNDGIYDMTPAQAVEATLGAGTCHLNKVTSSLSIFDARRCDECWNIAVYDSKHEPKFCPYCGRRVVEVDE